MLTVTKEILTTADHKPYVTEDMKLLKRSIMREYEKHGKSSKYFKLKGAFTQKLHKEVEKYRLKIETEVRNGDRSSAYSALRKLGAHSSEPSKERFELPSHSGMTAQESAEKLADHFSYISMNYEPIKMENFSPKIRTALFAPNSMEVPTLSEYEVFKKVNKAKKPNSAVPGDIPKKILKEFTHELALPFSIIFNAILRTFQYPRQWVREYQVPIPKVTQPNNEDDLRNIAKTSFASKVFEAFLADWLMPIVKPFIDPCQY